MMGLYELNLKRGLLAGLVAAALAFALPWLLLSLFLFANRLGADFDPSSDGAWLASYLLTSMAGTTAFVSFGTNPRSSFGRDLLAITLVAIAVPSLVGIVEGPRFKSDPPFGERPIDIVLLTVPAVAAGIAILAWRTLRVSRNGSATMEGPTRKEP